MATRVAGNQDGDGDGNGNDVCYGNGNKGGRHVTATRATTAVTATTLAVATETRLGGTKKGNDKGSKGNGNSD